MKAIEVMRDDAVEEIRCSLAYRTNVRCVSDEVKHGFVVAAATGQDEAVVALEMR